MPSRWRLLWVWIVGTEAYSQDEPSCHGYRRWSPQNETLFSVPGRFSVYVSYAIHTYVNLVTDQPDLAHGLLLRAVAIPGEPELIAVRLGLVSWCLNHPSHCQQLRLW